MTNKETIKRNIGLTFDFVHYLIDNPDIVKKLPENFKLEFIEKDFPNVVIKQTTKKETRSNKKFVKVRNTFELVE